MCVYIGVAEYYGIISILSSALIRLRMALLLRLAVALLCITFSGVLQRYNKCDT